MSPKDSHSSGRDVELVVFVLSIIFWSFFSLFYVFHLCLLDHFFEVLPSMVFSETIFAYLEIHSFVVAHRLMEHFLMVMFIPTHKQLWVYCFTSECCSVS